MTANGMETIKVEIPVDVIERAASKVADHYKRETGRKYPEWAVVKAIKNVFEERIGDLTEDIEELLISPTADESFLFRRYLEEALESVQVFDTAPDHSMETNGAGDQSVFTGFRPYDPNRLAAMATYIAGRGRDIYKTKLNKLLFYSDFIHYYLHGASISGSRYVHLPFGPVPEEYESVLQSAAESRQIELVPAGSDAVMVVGQPDSPTILSDDEISTLEWVISNYGELSSSAISEVSHREKAYKFTRQGEHIAYAYAKFFDKLP